MVSHRPSFILALGYTKVSQLTSPGKIGLFVFWAPRRWEEDPALTPRKRPGHCLLIEGRPPLLSPLLLSTPAPLPPAPITPAPVDHPSYTVERVHDKKVI